MDGILESDSFEATFVPEDLRTGDIIRCWLPTNYRDMGPEMAPRNALVVGLECDPGQKTVRGLYLVRFSYNTEKFQQGWEIDLTGIDQKTWGIEGLTKHAVLRTNRVDLVAVDKKRFRHGIKIMGAVHNADFFNELSLHLKEGLTSIEAEGSRMLKKAFYRTELRQSLDPEKPIIIPSFNLEELIHRESAQRLTDSADYDLSLAHVESIKHSEIIGTPVQQRVVLPPRAEVAPLAFSSYITPSEVRVPRKLSGSKARLKRARAVTTHNLVVRKRLEVAGIANQPEAPVEMPAPQIITENLNEKPLKDEGIKPGSIIMRLSDHRAKIQYPVLVWGLWQRGDNKDIVALDTMRLRSLNNAWSEASSVKTVLESLSEKSAFFDPRAVDVLSNAPSNFKPAHENTVIYQLDDEALSSLTKQRETALLKSPFRQNKKPHIFADWQRYAGVSYELKIENLATPIFAPDVPDFREFNADKRIHSNEMKYWAAFPG